MCINVHVCQFSQGFLKWRPGDHPRLDKFSIETHGLRIQHLKNSHRNLSGPGIWICWVGSKDVPLADAWDEDAMCVCVCVCFVLRTLRYHVSVVGANIALSDPITYQPTTPGTLASLNIDIS